MKAYPNLNKTMRKKLPKIKLNDRIFYVNAMESLASAIELEVISAKNIANIIY
jgi:hypothetical protein